jgi:hypothetical protein
VALYSSTSFYAPSGAKLTTQLHPFMVPWQQPPHQFLSQPPLATYSEKHSHYGDLMVSLLKRPLTCFAGWKLNLLSWSPILGWVLAAPSRCFSPYPCLSYQLTGSCILTGSTFPKLCLSLGSGPRLCCSLIGMMFCVSSGDSSHAA